MNRFLSFSVACLLATVPSQGALIGSRTALSSFLGLNAITEDFEQLPAVEEDQVDPDQAYTLDSTTIARIANTVLGGPNLVKSGIQFSSSEQLAWNGNGYFGLQTTTLVSNSDDGAITIYFTQPVNAFGLDLFAFADYGDVANVSILGTDQSTVIFQSANLTLPDSASGVFFGYGDMGGIGGAVIAQRTNPWSPILDNVEFGSAQAMAGVPEPAFFWLTGISTVLLLFVASKMK